MPPLPKQGFSRKCCPCSLLKFYHFSKWEGISTLVLTDYLFLVIYMGNLGRIESPELPPPFEILMFWHPHKTSLCNCLETSSRRIFSFRYFPVMANNDQSPVARKHHQKARNVMKDENAVIGYENLERISGNGNKESPDQMITSPTRPLGNKRQPKYIMQSPLKNSYGSPSTTDLTSSRQLNSSYSTDPAKDRLDRLAIAREKRTRRMYLLTMRQIVKIRVG